MVPAVARFCAAFALLCLPYFQLAKYDSSQDHVWFAVEELSRGQLVIEPIAAVDGEDLSPLQGSCLSGAEASPDPTAPYLQSGTKYPIFFGGAYSGDGLLTDQSHSPGTAILTYQGTAKIRSQSRALATNIETRDFRVASREEATAEQRRSALVLAREIFGQHGIREDLLRNVRIEYLTRTYLAPSPLPSLIGSFTLNTEDSDGLLHSMFFVASQPSDRLVPELIWLHLAESEMDEKHLRFVDHADLFGNGRDEIVAKLVSIETQTHRYVVLRRSKDGAHWEQFFKSEPLGCGT